MDQGVVADPGRVDPDPTFKNKLDPTVEKKKTGFRPSKTTGSDQIQNRFLATMYINW